MVEEIKKVSEDRLKKIEELRKQISKEFGKEALVDFTGEIKKVESISTCSLTLDKALGIGGYPVGRVVEIFGMESSGKSTLAIHAVAEAQRLGRLAAYIDVESAYDPYYASALGVDHESLFFSQPQIAEEGLQIAEKLIDSGEFSIVVLDSVAALTPMAEFEGDIGQNHMSLQARLMGQTMRKLPPKCKKTKTMLFAINQLRSSMNPYGSHWTTPGGNALRFSSSVRIELKKKEKVGTDKAGYSGNYILAKVIKNKVAPPFKEAMFEIEFGKGINKASEIIDLAVEYGFVQKGGAWYTFGEEKFQGKEKFGEYLKENEDIAEELEKEIREKLYGN